MVKHGSSAAFNYNHSWRWIDCLWIPFFSFLERIWKPQLESNMHTLVQQGKWFTTARGPHLRVWGKKKKRYNFTDKGSSCDLRETLNGLYHILKQFDCFWVEHIYSCSFLNVAFSQNEKKSRNRIFLISDFKLFLFTLVKAITYL